MSLVGSCTVRTPESTQVPSGKPIWQARKMQILDSWGTKISIHSMALYNCLILFARWVMESEVIDDRWKLSSTQPMPCQGICQGFAALDGCSFCHYVTMSLSTFQWMTLTLNTPYMSTFPCLYLCTAQFAAPVADHFGRKLFCIRHCFMVKASQWENKHIFRVPAIGFHQSHIMGMGL